MPNIYMEKIWSQLSLILHHQSKLDLGKKIIIFSCVTRARKRQ